MRIYFSGIGGVGIGPLAMLALDAGHFVLGSDLSESDMTRTLKARGALVRLGQSGEEIAAENARAEIDWFVYSSALPTDHPELLFAKENGIKASKRDEFLNYLLKEKNLKLLAVSGTHGKTTTTGMLVWLFKQLEIPVSYSVGTTIHFGAPAEYVEGSEYFVYECDEFDKNFLHFTPDYSVVPSLDYDHVETYPTREKYNSAFQEFIANCRHTLLWESAARQLRLEPGDALTILNTNSAYTSSITLSGEHMRQNAFLAVTALQELLGLEASQLIEAINSFPGTDRRFEELSENIYTDYAHHPSEIAATIAMAKEVNPRVVVVYQPHQNIRQHELIKEEGYKECFKQAQKVYWLPTYLSREYRDLPTLPASELAQTIRESTDVETAELGDELWKNILKHQKNGELVVCMSAGNLDDWLRSKL